MIGKVDITQTYLLITEQKFKSIIILDKFT